MELDKDISEKYEYLSIANYQVQDTVEICGYPAGQTYPTLFHDFGKIK